MYFVDISDGNRGLKVNISYFLILGKSQRWRDLKVLTHKGNNVQSPLSLPFLLPSPTPPPLHPSLPPLLRGWTWGFCWGCVLPLSHTPASKAYVCLAILFSYGRNNNTNGGWLLGKARFLVFVQVADGLAASWAWGSEKLAWNIRTNISLSFCHWHWLPFSATQVAYFEIWVGSSRTLF